MIIALCSGALNKRTLFLPAMISTSLLYFLVLGGGIIGPGVASAAGETAREVFINLPERERMTIQSVLREHGSYLAEVDGLWGSATSRALRNADPAVNLEDVDAVRDLYRRILEISSAGSSGAVSADMHASAMTTRSDKPGVFYRVAGSRAGTARLEDRGGLVGRQGICRADIGQFTDGHAIVDLMMWRAYDSWGLVITSDERFDPLLVPEAPFSENPLPMNAQSRRVGTRYETEYLNTNTHLMDSWLASRSSLALHVARNEYIITIEIPELPRVLADFQSCAEREEHEHRRAFCAQFPVADRNFHRQQLGSYCDEHW